MSATSLRRVSCVEGFEHLLSPNFPSLRKDNRPRAKVTLAQNRARATRHHLHNVTFSLSLLSLPLGALSGGGSEYGNCRVNHELANTAGHKFFG
jgi:hypothetical protein